MKTVIINFTGGKQLSLRMPDQTAASVMAGLSSGSNGTTTINTDGGRGYVVNREQFTYATCEDE